VIGWEDYTLVKSFVLGFPYKDQIEELFIVTVFMLCIPNVYIVSFLINFTF